MQFQGRGNVFFVWRRNKAVPSLDCQWSLRRNFEQIEQRQCDTTLATYESCIVQVSYVTCDHVRSHMIDVETEITRIKKKIIINIVELDLKYDSVNNLMINMSNSEVSKQR